MTRASEYGRASRERELPDWLDQSIEGTQDLDLANVKSFVEAQQHQRAVEQAKRTAIPREADPLTSGQLRQFRLTPDVSQLAQLPNCREK